MKKILYIILVISILFLVSIFIYIYYNNAYNKSDKIWINKTYQYSITLPYNWMAINPYTSRSTEFFDNIETISPVEDPQFYDSIWLSSVVAEDYDNINNNYLSSMYKNNGKIYEDYFRKGDLNTLNYIYSSMSIQIWDKISEFTYDRRNKVQYEIIESIKAVQ